MQTYVRNRACPCLRCRAKGMAGAAFLITLGVLFLLENFNVLYFDHSWPILMIVAGLCMIASRGASMEGHIQPWETRGATRHDESQVQP